MNRAPTRIRTSTTRSGCWAAPLALWAGACAGGSPPEPARGATQKPNLILIVADDLGWGELGSYGQALIETPHLDRMAREGMRFEQFYAGAPVCAPSRCVLMTGLHSGHASIRDNQEVQPEGQQPIPDSALTIAEVLSEQGYVSGCFGKWGLGFPGSSGDPLRQGFDRFYGYNCQRHAHNFYPSYLWDDDRQVELEGNDRGLTGAQYSHDLIEREALAFIRENRERPFFCYVPFTIPHLALQVPAASLAQYGGRWAETPYAGTSYLPHPQPRAAYAAMISHMDRSVGRMLALVEELGLDDRTLVLFTSDNGPTHLEQQVDYRFFESTAGLRGLKGSVYEGGLRVPLIARWPGRIEAGSTSALLAAFQDLLPTLSEAASAAPPVGIDGLSFLPTLLQLAGQREHDALVFESPGYGGQQALRSGNWKAVRTGLRQDPHAPVQLYDLAHDPGEAHDVAGEHPQTAERLWELLRNERTPALEPRFELPGFSTGP